MMIVDNVISVLQTQKNVAQQYISLKKNVEQWKATKNICEEIISMLKHNLTIAPEALEETLKRTIASSKKTNKKKKGVTQEDKFRASATIEVCDMVLKRFF